MRFPGFIAARISGNRTENTLVTKLDDRPLDARQAQRFNHQTDHLRVRIEPCLTVDFGPRHQRYARFEDTLGVGVNHRPGVTETLRGIGSQAVGIDSRGLEVMSARMPSMRPLN